MAERAVDDERRAVGPLLARFVGTPRRRRWARRLLGIPTLTVRWAATRSDSSTAVTHSQQPSAPAPALERFAGVQLPSDGAGPGIHRTYRVRALGRGSQAGRAVERLANDPNLHCTIELGSFEVDDDGGVPRLDVGRDLRVELFGPYDGPVRVVERAPGRICLQTRRRHIEAGQIVFQAVDEGGDLVFTIESWTRSRDRAVDLLYRSGPARWFQEHMWISVCRQVALGAGAERPTHVHVRTEWLPGDPALLGE